MPFITRIRSTISELMYQGGMYRACSTLFKGRLRILMYHRFSQEPKEGFTSAKELDSQLKYIKRQFSLFSLSEVADTYNRGREMPGDPVALTVDDGYADFYEVALPVFLKHKVPVAVFVCTAFIDKIDWLWTDKIKYLISRTEKERIGLPLAHDHVPIPTSNAKGLAKALADSFEYLYSLDPNTLNRQVQAFSDQLEVDIPESVPQEYRPMTWDQIRKLVHTNVEIGAHGVSHNILTNLSREQVVAEVHGSRDRIFEELGKSPALFCYPNGNTNPEVSRIVSSAGFVCAVMTEFGFNDKNADRYSLKRIGVGNLPFSYFVKSLSGFDLMVNSITKRRLAYSG